MKHEPSCNIGDGLPRPDEIIPLSMGDELRVYKQSIVIGPAAVYFNRNIERKDIEAVITLYTIGMAARSRAINFAHSYLMDLMSNTEITGYTEEKK